MYLDTIELPDDLVWTDEFTWTPVVQETSYSATGALFIQESKKLAGRPISLYGEQNMCWVSRETILDLIALRNEAGKTMVLKLSDNREFTVMFVQSAAPIETEHVRPGSFFDNDDYYKIKSINLMEV